MNTLQIQVVRPGAPTVTQNYESNTPFEEIRADLGLDGSVVLRFNNQEVSDGDRLTGNGVLTATQKVEGGNA